MATVSSSFSITEEVTPWELSKAFASTVNKIAASAENKGYSVDWSDIDIQVEQDEEYALYSVAPIRRGTTIVLSVRAARNTK